MVLRPVGRQEFLTGREGIRKRVEEAVHVRHLGELLDEFLPEGPRLLRLPPPRDLEPQQPHLKRGRPVRWRLVDETESKGALVEDGMRVEQQMGSRLAAIRDDVRGEVAIAMMAVGVHREEAEYMLRDVEELDHLVLDQIDDCMIAATHSVAVSQRHLQHFHLGSEHLGRMTHPRLLLSSELLGRALKLRKLHCLEERAEAAPRTAWGRVQLGAREQGELTTENLDADVGLHRRADLCLAAEHWEDDRVRDLAPVKVARPRRAEAKVREWRAHAAHLHW